jgi:hypothetical protein
MFFAGLAQKWPDFRVISLRIAGKFPSLRDESAPALPRNDVGSPTDLNLFAQSRHRQSGVILGFAGVKTARRAERSFGFSANLRYFCIPSRFVPVIPTFSGSFRNSY